MHFLLFFSCIFCCFFLTFFINKTCEISVDLPMKIPRICTIQYPLFHALFIVFSSIFICFCHAFFVVFSYIFCCFLHAFSIAFFHRFLTHFSSKFSFIFRRHIISQYICYATVGHAALFPFVLVDEHSLPSLTAASPGGASSENEMSQSIRLHISRARTQRNEDLCLRPRLSRSTATPSSPWHRKRIISQSSIQHRFGHPEGKLKMSAARTKSGCMKKVCE